MNCLYLVSDDPISQNYSGGGSSIYYDQLLALNSIGCNVTILHYASNAKRKEYNEFYQKNAKDLEIVRKNSREIIYWDYNPKHNKLFKLRHKLFSFSNSMRMEIHLAYLPLYKKMAEICKSGNMDFIWAQHFHPASIAVNIKDVPVVYMHHDWIYKIKALKNNTPEDLNHKTKEMEVCKLSSAVVSGSFTEYMDIFKLGIPNSFYIPSTYPLQKNLSWAEIPDIIHLGGMNTTANRIGLENFINNVWDELKLPKNRLRIIGKLDGASLQLVESIKAFTWQGFVPDLSGVMRRGDIHIVPWHENTGTRTRVPLALSYGQVLVAVEASVKCFPELKNMHNCILVSKLSDMGDAIIKILNDEALRMKISDNAIVDFEKYFLEGSQQMRYASVVNSIIKIA